MKITDEIISSHFLALEIQQFQNDNFNKAVIPKLQISYIFVNVV